MIGAYPKVIIQYFSRVKKFVITFSAPFYDLIRLICRLRLIMNDV